MDKKTQDLEKVLGSAHPDNLSDYLKRNADEMIGSRPFYDYMNGLFRAKKLVRKNVFAKADIPEDYGYKLLTGEKHTNKRDVILRICFAAGMNTEEVQRALKTYGLPVLYVKNPRDAALYLLFGRGYDNVENVSDYLIKNNFPPLDTCGEDE